MPDRERRSAEASLLAPVGSGLVDRVARVEEPVQEDGKPAAGLAESLSVVRRKVEMLAVEGTAEGEVAVDIGQ